MRFEIMPKIKVMPDRFCTGLQSGLTGKLRYVSLGLSFVVSEQYQRM